MKTSNTTARDHPVNGESNQVTIERPDIWAVIVDLIGTAPYVSNRMGDAAMLEMREKLLKSGTAVKKKRAARDFDQLYRESMHTCQDQGWHGVPTNALRHAMIRACSLSGFEMTKAKLVLSILPHGFSTNKLPLLKLQGEPKPFETRVVTQNRPNIAVRAMWEKWSLQGVSIQFDHDIFSPTDIINLLLRAGQQVGIGAGRPGSANSVGMGWGTFQVSEKYALDSRK